MAARRTHDQRLLAIDPSSKGFAFAVLEGLSDLVDWGTREAKGEKNASCVQEVQRLIEWYRPDGIVLEDADANTRRCARVRLLLAAIADSAQRAGIAVVRISWQQVQIACGASPTAPKHWVARGVLARFPELRRQFPPRRQPWKSEDHRTGIFDALALAVTVDLATQRPRSRRREDAA